MPAINNQSAKSIESKDHLETLTIQLRLARWEGVNVETIGDVAIKSRTFNASQIMKETIGVAMMWSAISGIC